MTIQYIISWQKIPWW